MSEKGSGHTLRLWFDVLQGGDLSLWTAQRKLTCTLFSVGSS